MPVSVFSFYNSYLPPRSSSSPDELLQGCTLAPESRSSLRPTSASRLFGRSPTTVNTGRGPQFEGAVITLFHYFSLGMTRAAPFGGVGSPTSPTSSLPSLFSLPSSTAKVSPSRFQ